MTSVSTSRPLRAPRTGRLLIAVAVLLGIAGPTVAIGNVPAAAGEAVGPADRAGRWLASQVVDGSVTTGGVADPGLSADVGLALTAAGRADDAASAIARELLDRPAAYVAPSGPGQVVSGAVAKLALLAGARGLDPTDAGGTDLIADLLGTMVDAPGSADDGRFRDRPPTAVPALADRSNAFSQALGVLALARRGLAPGPAVQHLLAQQCPGGAFRLFLTGGRSCSTDAAADVDTTALAVVALRAVGPTTAPAVERALDALERFQASDGSFASSGPGATANANSTGLAAHALRTGDRTGTADRAAAWLSGLQVGCSPEPADDGAIAFSPAARAAASAGITPTSRDQFRRATSQAILAFSEAPLGTAGTRVTTAAACPSPVGSTTTTTTTTTTSTSTTSTVAPSTTGPPATAPADAPPVARQAAVLGVTATAPGAAASGGASAGRALALTGSDPQLSAAAGLAAVVAGILLSLAVRRRRP
jgi:hypothetical protein